MSEKRYFKKEYDEECYIFDSEIITEAKFEEKFDYEDYTAFEDSMNGEEIVDLLNSLTEENRQLVLCQNQRRECDVEKTKNTKYE